MRDYKAISTAAAKLLKEADAAIIDMDGGNAYVRIASGESFVDLSGGKPLAEVDRYATAKDVRRFMWEHRDHRALRRAHAAVWLLYSDGHTLLGIGALTPSSVGQRLVQMNKWVDVLTPELINA